jgi:hypothetical protein
MASMTITEQCGCGASITITGSTVYVRDEIGKFRREHFHNPPRPSTPSAPPAAGQGPIEVTGR